MAAAVSSVFVGRASEVGRVRRVIERAQGGVAGALVVNGEAGVGKTALVQHVLDGCTGVLVLQGGCLPLSTFTLALAPVRTALRAAPARLPPAPVLTDRGNVHHEAPVELDHWFDAVAADVPVVLAIDDLHWADQSTLDVLQYVLAGRRSRRLAVLATVRRTVHHPGHPLNPWLADVSRLPGLDQLTLGPLSQTETRAQMIGLLGAPPHESLVGEVFERSRGNSYLNRLLVSGLDATAKHLPTPLHDDLHAALLANWHRLGPSARELTTMVAVAGLRAGAVELTRMIRPVAPTVDVARALDEAVRGQVLEVAADGTYWFHHPLQAEVLHAHLPRDQSARWHEVFAAHVESNGGGVGTSHTEALILLADHQFAAGRHGPARTASVRAAEAAVTSGAYRDAIRLVRRAADLEPSGSGPRTREELLWWARRLAEDAADFGAERSVIDDLLAMINPRLHPLDVSWLTVRRIHLRQVLVEDFAPTAVAAVAVSLSAASPESWQYAYALAEQARIGVWTGDASATAASAQALTAALAAGHPRALSFAYTAAAMVCFDRGELDETVTLARHGREAAVEARDFWAYVHATVWEANAVETWASPVHSELMHEARVEMARLGAPPAYVNVVASIEAESALMRGDWSTTAALLRTLLGSGLHPLPDVRSRLVAARLAALQGRTEEAVAHLERADELSARLPSFASHSYAVVSAEVSLHAGQPEQAARLALAGVTAWSAGGSVMCEWLVPLAARALADQAQRARHQQTSAEEVLATLGQLESDHPPPPDGTVDHPSIIADLAVPTDLYLRQIDALGHWYAAECGRARHEGSNAQQWETAAASLTEIGLPWEAAYADYRVAEAHLDHEHGDRHTAAAALRRSAQVARQLGARPVLDRVERLARVARIRLSDPVGDGGDRGALGGLTPRENEILAHVVAGRTYREIAQSLTLSEKTVGTHISNMLRKTGSSNRVELARRADEATG